MDIATSTGSALTASGEKSSPRTEGDEPKGGARASPKLVDRKKLAVKHSEKGEAGSKRTKGGLKRKREPDRAKACGLKGGKRSPPAQHQRKGDRNVKSITTALANEVAKIDAISDSSDNADPEPPNLSFKPGFHSSWDSFIKLLGPIAACRLQPVGQWGDALVRQITNADTVGAVMVIGYGKDVYAPFAEQVQYWLVTRPFYLTDEEGNDPEMVCYWDHQFMPLRDGIFKGWAAMAYSSEWVLLERTPETAGVCLNLPPIYPRWIEVPLDNKDNDLVTAMHARVLRGGSSGLYKDTQAISGFSFTLTLNRFYPLIQDIVRRNGGCIWTVPQPNYAVASGLLDRSIAVSDNAASSYLESVRLGRRAVVDFFKLLPARTFHAVNAMAAASTDLGGAAYDKLSEAAAEVMENGTVLEEPAVDEVPLLSESSSVTQDHLEKMETVAVEDNGLPDERPQLRAFFGGIVNSAATMFTSLPLPTFGDTVQAPSFLTRCSFNQPGGGNTIFGDYFEWDALDNIKDPVGDIVDHQTFLANYEKSVVAIKQGIPPVYPIDLSCVPKYDAAEVGMFETTKARKSWYAWESAPYHFPSKCEIAKICTVINRCCLKVPKRTVYCDPLRYRWRGIDSNGGVMLTSTIPGLEGYPDDRALREAYVSNMPPRARKIRLQPFDVSESASKHEFCVKMDETLVGPKARGLVNVGNKSFWDTRIYVKHCTDQLNSVRAFHTEHQFRPGVVVHVFFSYGAEMTPFEKSAWMRWVHVFVSCRELKHAVFTLAGGDDTATVLVYEGKIMYLEKDLTMCDQSHDVRSVNHFVRSMVALALLNQTDAAKFGNHVLSDFRLNFDVMKSRRPFLPTGIGPTSLFNTLVVGLEEVEVAARMFRHLPKGVELPTLMDSVKKFIVRDHENLGRKVKVKVTDNQNLFTFHKGVWIGPDFIWTPLPSRCWKFGVTPFSVSDADIPNFLADVAWSWSTSRLDPVFHAFIAPHLVRARAIHGTEPIFGFTDEVHNEAPAWFRYGSGETSEADLAPLTLEYCEKFYLDRYGLSGSDVAAMIDEIGTYRCGTIIYQEDLIMRIIKVDLLD